MKRKHFEAIANILRYADVSSDSRDDLAVTFANWLGDVNPRFDRLRFLEASSQSFESDAYLRGES